MMNLILADVGYYETRAAILENGRVAEIHFERTHHRSLVNQIYLGQVINVLHSLQTVFLDIGTGHNVFLHEDEMTVPISQVKTGQLLMVQIIKDALDKKGPKSTMHYSLPGRYLVMLPNQEHVGISNRILKPDERTRLFHLEKTFRPESHHGIIFRTEAAKQPASTLLKDWKYLTSVWNSIETMQYHAPGKSLLYSEQSLLLRLLRDAVNVETQAFIVNSDSQAQMLQNFCLEFSPDLSNVIESISPDVNPFNVYHVDEAWKRAMGQQIDLPGGGNIILNHTEAMTTIDVNTAGSKGKQNFQETAFATNMEAVDEIARQLRLRDIGGIILIDFIDMKNKKNHHNLLNHLTLSLKKDRQKTVVMGFTHLGLVEMTRKRTRHKMETLFQEPCRFCSGTGVTQSVYWSLYEIETAFRRLSVQTDVQSVHLRIHPLRHREFLQAHLDLKHLATVYGLTLTVFEDESVPLIEHILSASSQI